MGDDNQETGKQKNRRSQRGKAAAAKGHLRRRVGVEVTRHEAYAIVITNSSRNFAKLHVSSAKITKQTGI
jgi:hypothetical protein